MTRLELCLMLKLRPILLEFMNQVLRIDAFENPRAKRGVNLHGCTDDAIADFIEPHRPSSRVSLRASMLVARAPRAFVHPAFVHLAFVHPTSVPLCSSVTSVSSVSAARQGPKQMAVR